MPIAKLTIRIKLRMSNEHTTYSLTKIGSCYGKLLSYTRQTWFPWLDNICNNPSWKSGKHGNNIWHSHLIHLPNMSILTMIEAYSNNLHELATVYWGQKKNQIKSVKFQNTQSQICYLYLLKFNNWNNLFAQLGLITISPYLYCLFAVWNVYDLIIIK